MNKCKYNNTDCEVLKIFGIYCRAKRLCLICENGKYFAKVLKSLLKIDYEIPQNTELIIWAKKNKNNIKSQCCGRVKNIIMGFGRLITDEILGKQPPDWVVKRAEKCAACEYRTFLDVVGWAIGFVAKRDLPINHKPGRFDRLWCSKCKCCIEAKIRVKNERCIIGEWEAIKDESSTRRVDGGGGYGGNPSRPSLATNNGGGGPLRAKQKGII